ncbi:AGAP011755-PA, partial [Anopheles gambiae str. PEST]
TRPYGSPGRTLKGTRPLERPPALPPSGEEGSFGGWFGLPRNSSDPGHNVGQRGQNVIRKRWWYLEQRSIA